MEKILAYRDRTGKIAHRIYREVLNDGEKIKSNNTTTENKSD